MQSPTLAHVAQVRRVTTFPKQFLENYRSGFVRIGTTCLTFNHFQASHLTVLRGRGVSKSGCRLEVITAFKDTYI